MSHDINAILKKVLLASSSIGNDELEKYLTATIKLNTEEVITLLLDVQNKVSEKEFERILTHLPTSHQEYILILLKCSRKTDTKLQRLNQTYIDMKEALLKEVTYKYIVDTTLEKEQFKQYISPFSNAKIALVLDALKESDKTEINMGCTQIIESIEQSKKVI